ncbi:MAG: hypothetical protein J6P53_01895 [Mailhella sp.]|nr:hypothetical protein [Mailhella sp.]
MAHFARSYPVMLFDLSFSRRADIHSLLTYYEECVASFCKTYHVTGFDLDPMNLMGVGASTRVRILDVLPLWNEEMRVEIWISGRTRLRLDIDFRAFYGDTAVAEGSSCWLILDKTTRRPANLTELLEALPEEGDPVFTGKHRETVCDERCADDSFRISCSDTDYNGHVGNISYVKWALHYFKTYAGGRPVREFSVRYGKECFNRDEVDVLLARNGDDFCFTVTRHGEDAPACRIGILAG